MEDRRVQRTRKMLEQALLELIEEKGYESITVQQITDRANIGRATFYVHFADKEQLMLATLQTLLNDLERQLHPLTTQDLVREETGLVTLVFQHVAQHRRLYRVLLSERGAAFVRYRLVDYVTEQTACYILSAWLSIAPESTVPESLLVEYLSGTLITAMTWWLNHQQQKTPEEMDLLVRKMIVPSMISMLGIDPASFSSVEGMPLFSSSEKKRVAE